jgi:signal transduction histidine kinase
MLRGNGMSLTEQTLRRLLDVGRSLVRELDPDAVLDHILEEARLATGARYAALGVLNEKRTELARFITAGIEAHTRETIGDLPRGRGVLGVLIAEPTPVRLDEVSEHPQSYGFPSGHPTMHGFLGVPILIRGTAWGNLYLADKRGDEPFSEGDEEVAVILADLAATAIENARLYHDSEQRREQLERAVMGLEAAREIADAAVEAVGLERVLDLTAKRAVTLVSARSVLALLREDRQLLVGARAGDGVQQGDPRLPIAGSAAGLVATTGATQRIEELNETHRRIAAPALGYEPRTALLAPMSYRGDIVGVLGAYDRRPNAQPFTAQDEEVLRTLAASAATAVALTRSVEADRLRAAIASSETERRRWARELHDETLQALGGLRVLLASALRRGDPERLTEVVGHAIEDIEAGIHNLRGIIADLRPSLLDDLGLQPAIEALLDRRRAAGMVVVGELELPDRDRGRQLAPELETTIYRLVQEALTNIVKHASASTVRVSVRLRDGSVCVEVSDDGVGFDTASTTVGFGLVGIRERIFLAGGTFQLDSGTGGTVLRATVPVQAGPPQVVSHADEPAAQGLANQLGAAR